MLFFHGCLRLYQLPWLIRSNCSIHAELALMGVSHSGCYEARHTTYDYCILLEVKLEARSWSPIF